MYQKRKLGLEKTHLLKLEKLEINFYIFILTSNFISSILFSNAFIKLYTYIWLIVV